MAHESGRRGQEQERLGIHHHDDAPAASGPHLQIQVSGATAAVTTVTGPGPGSGPVEQQQLSPLEQQPQPLQPIDIPTLLSLSEGAVWSLRKSELRRCFLALQAHARANANANANPAAAAAHSQLSLLRRSTSLGSPGGEQSSPSPSPFTASDAVRPPPLSTTPSFSSTASQPPQLSISSSTRSRLLLLPPELRRLILLHLIRPSQSSSSTLNIRGPHPRQLQAPLSLTYSFEPSVLRVCRQLYVEAAAIFYGSSGQLVHVHIDYNVWAHRKSRSELTIGSVVRDAIRHLHVHVFLGNEKRTNRPDRTDAAARLEVVRKGVRKLGKWIAGLSNLATAASPSGLNDGRETAGKEEDGGWWRLQTLRISWQEPPQTYTWEQKKGVLDEFRAMRPKQVEVGEINWGLNYPGKKFRFVEDYLKELVVYPNPQEGRVNVNVAVITEPEGGGGTGGGGTPGQGQGQGQGSAEESSPI
ncbi:hypothetical protein QBC46DRAFT_383507 [Diplogelasinospora grovesii]|uniref:Uncharacterized protein n=1 Tax=Diplogelasinospora grovesii TaxID=303347 RepID=A0AAN6N8M7_9PEZI|nr:hypothetical protein QBC46DRAFT_383507 [Diplogelasinospora grovesii]